MKVFDDLPENKNAPVVLIVDDEETVRESLRTAVLSTQYASKLRVLNASKISDAIKIISETRVHVVILDKCLNSRCNEEADDPHDNALKIIPEILQIQPHAQILMVANHERAEDIITAIKYGAFGFVKKTCDPELLICQIGRALSVAEVVIENARKKKLLQSSSVEDRMGGKSALIKDILRTAEAVSDSYKPVLLCGETGTGKTTLAEFIHRKGTCEPETDKRPFFAVNIAAFSEELVERELFGNEKGAFTDAREQKLGFFELAHNGTLFLDEIGEASESLQVKLLKVIGERKFFRLGGTKEIHSNFRLVCATNRDLQKMVEEGKFREDLYNRIATFSIRVPSLSERKEDIPEIIKAALPLWCKDNNVFVAYEELPESFIECLVNNPPKGNIRGLEQAVSRLLVLSPRDRAGRPVLRNWKKTLGLESATGTASSSKLREKITLDELMTLPLDVTGPDFPGLEVVREKVIEKIFDDAFEKFGGNNAVARALKISPASVSIRQRRYKALNISS